MNNRRYNLKFVKVTYPLGTNTITVKNNVPFHVIQTKLTDAGDSIDLQDDYSRYLCKFPSLGFGIGADAQFLDDGKVISVECDAVVTSAGGGVATFALLELIRQDANERYFERPASQK